jgi:phospholipase/carboxylesterase
LRGGLPRRLVLRLALAGVVGVACERELFENSMRRGGITAGGTYGRGQLKARPAPTVAPDGGAGRQLLGIVSERDAVLSVPEDYRADEPRPLLVMLHGAGANGENALDIVNLNGKPPQMLVLAPSSRESTWDVLRGGFGPDVELLDRALAHTFVHFAVDPARLSVGGFSDGASYALGLGVANGTLFGRVVAFSPGFVPRAPAAGKPGFLVTHGVHDDVLPIDQTSRRLVPTLRRAGYEVDYREFEGGHEVPTELVREALDWLTHAN